MDKWKVYEDTPEKSGAYDKTPMMEEIKEALKNFPDKKYSKEEMLMFGGFCAGKFRINPNISGEELWEEWEKLFKS